VGPYRSNPCRHPLRRVSARWQGAWERYLTNVLDAQVWSARQVCELYRRRWRLEDACALTKRLLDLAYVWTGSTNAVPWQIDATLMFYAVLVTICQQVAQALGEPLERISVEMVLRAFYHDSRAVQRGESDPLVSFLAEHAKLLGIVKRQRKAHRERQHLDSLMWGEPSVETDASYGSPTACTLWHARSCPAWSWLLEGHHATALHPGREPRLLPVSATPLLGPHQPAHPVPHVAIQLWQLHGPMSALDIVPPARHHQVAPTDDRGQSRRPSLSADARVDVLTDRLPGLLAWPPIGEQCARALGAPRLKLAPQDVEPCRSHPHQAGLGRVEWACPLLADQADRV
jgi:hypothetical protein